MQGTQSSNCLGRVGDISYCRDCAVLNNGSTLLYPNCAYQQEHNPSSQSKIWPNMSKVNERFHVLPYGTHHAEWDGSARTRQYHQSVALLVIMQYRYSPNIPIVVCPNIYIDEFSIVNIGRIYRCLRDSSRNALLNNRRRLGANEAKQGSHREQPRASSENHHKEIRSVFPQPQQIPLLASTLKYSGPREVIRR